MANQRPPDRWRPRTDVTNGQPAETGSVEAPPALSEPSQWGRGSAPSGGRPSRPLPTVSDRTAADYVAIDRIKSRPIVFSQLNYGMAIRVTGFGCDSTTNDPRFPDEMASYQKLSLASSRSFVAVWISLMESLVSFYRVFFLVFTEFYHFRRFQSMNRPTVPEIGKPVSFFFFRFGLLFNDEKKKERGTISFI